MTFWSVLALLAIGIAIGLFIGAKFINTPSTEYNLRKIKIKGSNTVTLPDIETTESNPEEKKNIIKKLFKRKKNG